MAEPEIMQLLADYVRADEQPGLRMTPREYRLDGQHVVGWVSRRAACSPDQAREMIADALAAEGVELTRVRFDRSDEVRGHRGSTSPGSLEEWWVPRGLLDGDGQAP